jgi:hypothetical protein
MFFKANYVHYSPINGSWLLGEEVVMNLSQVVRYSVVDTSTKDTSLLYGKVFDVTLTYQGELSGNKMQLTSIFLEQQWENL